MKLILTYIEDILLRKYNFSQSHHRLTFRIVSKRRAVICPIWSIPKSWSFPVRHIYKSRYRSYRGTAYYLTGEISFFKIFFHRHYAHK